jgi:hypothetical protein
MSNQLGAICRESTWADKVWPHLARYIAQARYVSTLVLTSVVDPNSFFSDSDPQIFCSDTDSDS